MGSDSDKARQLFQKYVDAAADLAEAVKDNIIHNGLITDKTVVLLNAFIIISNEIADSQVTMELTDENESDTTLN